MASTFYQDNLPDYGDTHNAVSRGYMFCLVEQDGGIGIQMIPGDKDPIETPGYGVFLDILQAKELQEGLAKAIARAETKI